MSSGARTVRRLRLRAGSEDVARRTALTVEDALRVASLPDRAGCVLLVRRLALPPLPPDASSQSLALALERAVARTRAGWVHGGSPQAAQASAVWFRDALDAHVHAARALLARGALAAWFWPLAIPEVRDAHDPPALLRRVALSLAARPEAPAAVPAWLRAVVAEEGGKEALRGALRGGGVLHLAAAAGLSLRLGVGPRPPAGRAESRAPSTRGSASEPAPRRPEERQLDALLVAVSASPLAAPASPAPGEHARNASPEGSRAVGSPTAWPTGPGDGVWSAVPTVGGAARPRTPSPTPPRGLAPGDPRAAPPAGTAAPFPPLDDAWTSAGGLLFLLAVFRHLSYPAWLDAHAAWAPHDPLRRTLTRLLARLGVPLGDPMWGLAEATVDPLEPVPLRFAAPRSWRALWRGEAPLRQRRAGRASWITDPSGRLLLGAWTGRATPRALGHLWARRDTAAPRHLPRASDAPGALRLRWADSDARVEAVTHAWLTACRRWVRTRVGIGLTDLVLRPASLAATATHVDVTLDLAAADVRIRRTGLDLDPGWLPWLGRVVTFGYEPLRDDVFPSRGRRP
jgi:hypothetical protein